MWITILDLALGTSLRKQIKEVVEKIGSPQGGLMVFGSISGNDVPLENIEALCKAMEEYCLKGK